MVVPFLVSSLSLLLSLAPAFGTPTDADLLLAFKASFTNGDVVLETWAGGDPCSDNWLGVSCSENGRVTDISLESKQLKGPLPQPDGWALPDSLRTLSLGVNAISGSIPPALSFPASLTTLDLRGNRLEGPIPPSLVLPAGLRRLHLGFNQLTALPETLALPESLEELAVPW
jgi:Leucine-rich repeat (LRR) protein